MINIRNLRLKFGDQIVFDDISLSLSGSERIGLFGLNGSGKSTLLKAIAGFQRLDGGKIDAVKGSVIAYLPQEVTLQSDKSIIDETMTTFNELSLLLSEMATCEADLASDPGNLTLLDKYAHLCEGLAALEPDQKRARTQRILCGLGFASSQLNQPVATLSVGWKMRIVLAKLLLTDADFYLFDEPTNHLDIIAKKWFLDFMAESNVGFMLVCHEKRFLNTLCDTIVELERGNATLYSGNYDDYVTEKEAAQTRLLSVYENQQRTLQQMQDNVNRFRAKANKARQAQSMIKKMDKIERVTLPPKPKEVSFRFPPIEQSHRIVLTVSNVSHCFRDHNIFSNVSFSIERASKVAIVAANGVGKTTLLNLITGRIPLQTGSIEFGTNVTVALFDQDQTASLNLNRTVFENACDGASNSSEQEIRSFLGAFLFVKEMINKKASVLSGGERNRLGMIRVLLQKANLLLLDEPTNHLDIPSKDILLKALQAYKGTMIFVSHDHDFVNELATHIIELTPNGATLYHGSYDAYLYQKQSISSTIPTPAFTEKKATTKSSESDLIDHSLRKKARALEQKIQAMERDIAHTEESFADTFYGSKDYKELSDRLLSLKKQHAALLSEWETLHAE